jgi:hypothetical protein
VNRWALAIGLLAVSVALSAILYLLGVPFCFVILLLPLAPLFGRRRAA